MRPPTSRLSKLGRALAVASLALLVFAGPAAAGIAPVESQSPNADAIRTSYWVMFIVIVVLAVMLIGGLLLAARRFRASGAVRGEPRRLTAGRGVIARAGSVVGAIAIAIFVFGVVMTSDAREAEADPEAESIDIDVIGSQWLWRFEYPDSESETIATVFSYNELVVPVDTTINLAIDSTDVMHRWYIPALGGQVDAVPGEIATTSFRAEEEGVYPGQSTLFSGTAYPAMRAWVRVVSQDEYRRHVDQLSEDLGAAQSAVQGVAAEGDVDGSASEGSAEAGQ